jgi:hypothetical protein
MLRTRTAFGIALKNGLASGLASSCSKTILHPFDVVKTLQQSSVSSLSMHEAALQLLARGGPSAFYAGLLVSIIGSVPSVAVYFASYQFFKAHLVIILAGSSIHSCSGEASAPLGGGRMATAIAISAALANCVAACLRAPCELLKQRLQAGVYSSLPAALAAFRAALAGGGVAAGAAGAVRAQMLRDVPYAVVTLLAYEALHRAAAAARAAPRCAAAAAAAGAATHKPEPKASRPDGGGGGSGVECGGGGRTDSGARIGWAGCCNSRACAAGSSRRQAARHWRRRP